MRIRKRRFLTLVEILIVVSVLVIVLGAVGLNIRSAMITQRFRTEVDMLADNLRLAQNLMLILDRDVSVKIKPSGNEGIWYWVEVEGGAPKRWDSTIKRSRRLLESTHFIEFDKQDDFPTKAGEAELRFQSRGSMMSKGELRLSTHEDPYTEVALRKVICMPGYPYPFKSVSVDWVPRRGEPWMKCGDEELDKYMERVTNATREEVLNDIPPEGENLEKTPQQEEEAGPTP